MTIVEAGSVDPLTEYTKNRTLPDAYDHWAMRTVRPDLTSSRGYRYPCPGNVAYASEPDVTHRGACPRIAGDGICASTTYRGMASGSIPARTILLVAYRNGDVLGGTREQGKLRLSQMFVVDVLDGDATLKNMPGANLTDADLTGADLTGANLTVANLTGADLTGADLYRADLTGANLTGAYLTGADLTRADLTCADLYGADLTGADLSRADLTGADLTGADLARADLSRADLTGADLTGANLTRAVNVKLPEGWTVTETGIAVRTCDG